MNGFTSILRILLMNNLCFKDITKSVLVQKNRLIISMRKSNLWKLGKA